MYQCLCCGRWFRRPARRREAREYWGGPAAEEMLSCPFCGGSYENVFPEAHQEGEDGYGGYALAQED